MSQENQTNTPSVAQEAPQPVILTYEEAIRQLTHTKLFLETAILS